MATGTQLLTLEEFERLYAHQDTAYEYWFGEAVPKTMPTTLHGITQKIVALLLANLGYFTSIEVDLHIDPNWRPRPGVLASTRKLERPFPTRPDDLFVTEILSPEDRWGKVHERCELYERIIKINTVYILDPEARKGWEWNCTLQNTERITSLTLPKGDKLDLSIVWERLEAEI